MHKSKLIESATHYWNFQRDCQHELGGEITEYVADGCKIKEQQCIKCGLRHVIEREDLQ